MKSLSVYDRKHRVPCRVRPPAASLACVVLAFLGGATYLDASPSESRIVVRKLAGSPDARLTLPTAVSERVAAAGFSLLADYDAIAVFQGPTATASELLRDLQANGQGATLANELDSFFFHDHRVDADEGPVGISRPSPGVLYLLSLESFPKSSWLQTLRARGVQILAALPPAGYLVRSEAGRLAELRQELKYIRGVFPLPPELKVIDPEDLDSDTPEPFRPFVVQVAEENQNESIELLLASRSDTPVKVLDRGPGRVTYQAALADLDIPVLMAIDRVFEIALAGRASISSERPAQLIRAREEWDGQIFDTSGGSVLPPANSQPYLDFISRKFGGSPNKFEQTKIGLIDTGFDNADTSVGGIHPDFRFTHNGTTYPVVTNLTGAPGFFGNHEDRDSHGTIVASVAAGYPILEAGRGDAEGYLFSLGIAPSARLAIDKYLSCGVDSGTMAASISRLLPSGATVINASFNVSGWPLKGCKYMTDFSRVVDDQTRLSGLLFTLSAGNSTEACSGFPYSYVRAPGTAKNGLTVGSTDIDTLDWPNLSNAGICSWCDWFAVQDARRIPTFSARRYPTSLVKPDLVAPSTRLTGPVSRGTTGCSGILCFDNVTSTGDPSAKYGMSAGTSFAAPAAAGAATLVRKWYFDMRTALPTPAMSKAILINGARDIAGAPIRDQLYAALLVVGHIPDPYQGWGMLSFERLFGAASNYYFLDQSVQLVSSGTHWTGTLFIRNGARDTHVTLVWTDPSQTTEGKQYVAINNLDLSICGGAPLTCFLGNDIDSLGYSEARSPGVLVLDAINNVERVIIRGGTFPSGTSLAVDVMAYSLPQPSQDFALVAENAGE